MKVSICVCAHNEEDNISNLLSEIQNQRLNSATIEEIIVVASGCTDNTIPIVKEYANKDPRVILLTQEKREGKVAAINLFFQKATHPNMILMSSDISLREDSLEQLLKPLKENNVGMVCSRIIPVNNINSFLGYTTHLQWHLHHLLNLQEKTRPKVGEIAAFKKVFERLPPRAMVDEANIEPLIFGQGYRIVYNPAAIVYNKGPENLKDLIKVRRRNYAGHIQVKRRHDYTVSTFSGMQILKILLRHLPAKPKFLFLYTPLAVLLEAYCRFLGLTDYYIYHKNHAVWEIATSTKNTSKIRLGESLL